MTRFKDAGLPLSIPTLPIVVPRFKTSVNVSASGRENSNQHWEHPLHSFTWPEAIGRKWEVLNLLTDHFRVMRGRHYTWPLRDPFDFASCALVTPNEKEATVLARRSMTDQIIGTTDGFTDRFQLVKTYEYDGETYTRVIYHPIVSSVVIAVDGVLVPDTDYTVSRATGQVQFDTPPAAGDEVTAGFLFDVEVRYREDDALEQIMRATKAAGFGDLELIEVRPC